VTLKASEEVRLSRLASRTLIRGNVLFLPAPRGGIVELTRFLRDMWPVE